ncbi:MAG: hypothetical protein ACI8UO_003107 [Verrucomicrobiales bacterium]|jgi:hypothetical protein
MKNDIRNSERTENENPSRRAPSRIRSPAGCPPSSRSIRWQLAEAAFNASQADRQHQLRGISLYLDVPRPVTRIEITPGLNELDDYAALFNVRATGPAPGTLPSRLVLSGVDREADEQLPDSDAASPVDLRQFVATGVPDVQQREYDRIRLLTIWLLSPAGLVDPDAEIDQTWRPYVEQHQFWNFRHAVKLPPQQVAGDDVLRIPRGFASGAGDRAISELTREFLEQNNRASAFFAAVSGRFWSV